MTDTKEARAQRDLADREKFNGVQKVVTEPLIVRETRSNHPAPKNPEEESGRWGPDPDDLVAEKKARALKRRQEKRKCAATEGRGDL